MTTIALIGCSAKKNETAVPAHLLYQGRLFQAQLEYARQVLGIADEHIYVLSAKHGLVRLSVVLEPYDVALNKMSEEARREWGLMIAYHLGILAGHTGRHFKTVYVMGGRVYVSPVYKALWSTPTKVIVPHPDGAGYAQQVAWYEAELVKERGVQG